jgi:hypothetical protein
MSLRGLRSQVDSAQAGHATHLSGMQTGDVEYSQAVRPKEETL